VRPSEPAEIFTQKTMASLADSSFVRLVLSKPVNTELPQKILAGRSNCAGLCIFH
jgi:hypothetical protein